MEGFDHCCKAVHRFSPDCINRLAEALQQAYSGSKKKYEWKALATVIAGSNEGRVEGFWGQITWKHEDGQFESGDVWFNF